MTGVYRQLQIATLSIEAIFKMLRTQQEHKQPLEDKDVPYLQRLENYTYSR